MALRRVVLVKTVAARLGLGRVTQQSYNLCRSSEMFATSLLSLATSFVGSVPIWRLEPRVSR